MKFHLLSIACLLTLAMNTACKGNSTQSENQADSTQQQVPTAAEAADADTKPVAAGAFTHTPEAPIDGRLLGVVELGATGFNSFIVEMDAQNRWRPVKQQFGESAIKEGTTDEATVRTQLKDYITTILNNKVKGTDIHFVVSSGAAKEPLTATIIKALKSLGYVANVVSPEQEAQYAFKATMPKQLENEAFVVDMGSGNTKISYLQGGKLVAHETHGSKYFQNKVDDAKAVADVKAALSELPAAKSKTCFLIGGIPHKMAQLQRQGKERYTVLTHEVSAYDAMVKDKGAQAACGLNIFDAIVQTAGVQQVVFDWEANFTIGFLMSLKK